MRDEPLPPRHRRQRRRPQPASAWPTAWPPIRATFDLVLTNPPFGKKSSVTIVNEEGEAKRESQVIVRDDFWATTSNKQLNFVQHINTILKIHGRAAVVVPDNVLFEGGAGETVRRKLLHECDVHTLLRLPTGIFYAQGVKANVLFFDRKPARRTPWTSSSGSTTCAPTALHPEGEPAEPRRPGRIRGLLSPREPARATSHLVGSNPQGAGEPIPTTS